jgi:hypothetical protein
MKKIFFFAFLIFIESSLYSQILNPPILLSPPNGATNVSIHPIFDWTAVPGATGYILQVSKSPLFDSLVVNDTTPLGTITLQYNTTYYWRVCGMNSCGAGNWSNVWFFTTIMPVPPAPVLLSPCGVYNVSLTPLLDWTDVATASSYRVHVSTSPTFSNTILNIVVIASQYNIQSGVLNYNTIYYWRVASTNTGGQGTYSNVCSFTTLNQSGIKLISSEIPAEYKLYNNYPNPFNPNTNIKYQIPGTENGKSKMENCFVSLKVFNILGKEIKTLVNEFQKPGVYEVQFSMDEFPSGIYFYTIHSGDFTDTKRMLLIK